MLEFLIIVSFLCYVGAIMSVVDIFNGIGSDKVPFIALILLVCGTALYFLIRENTKPESCMIEKTTMVADTLDLDGSTYQLFLPCDMKIYATEYTQSLSASWDYTVYRVYIDSITYIEIRNDKYDTLDAKFGKLKVDGDE